MYWVEWIGVIFVLFHDLLLFISTFFYSFHSWFVQINKIDWLIAKIINFLFGVLSFPFCFFTMPQFPWPIRLHVHFTMHWNEEKEKKIHIEKMHVSFAILPACRLQLCQSSWIHLKINNNNNKWKTTKTVHATHDRHNKIKLSHLFKRVEKISKIKFSQAICQNWLSALFCVIWQATMQVYSKFGKKETQIAETN